MIRIENIIASLGLNENNGLFFVKDSLWKAKTSFPNRIKRLIEYKIRPDAFFCFDNKPLLLFFDNPSNKEELYEAIWNFNESPIAIIIENEHVDIYNGFNFLKNKKALEKFGGIDKLDNFSYFELVTGKTWEKYAEPLDYKNRVDYYLLKNIDAARRILISEQKLASKIANALIGKVIFVRYLIDRRVKLCFEGDSKYWTNEDFCNLLSNPQKTRDFFDYLENPETGFNGDLFPLHDEEYIQIQSIHYNTIKKLLKGEDLDNMQPSLFEFYDFSIIPIEFISNVYELFIGKDNQEKEGAYYTPLFLVDYILKETIENKLNTQENYDCKVLDPACGSGIFLVETLRKIIEKYISSGVDVKSIEFKETIKDITKKNIFGVDKDLNAVQVAIFSIYLTLLDYLDPPAIEDFKFPRLINENFFESDFFNDKAEFNTLFKTIKFDFIVGNPPWKGGGIGDLGSKYLKDRKKREKELSLKFDIAINNNEIAEGFVFRVSDFCSDITQVALIIRSSSLYNRGYNKEHNSSFRQYLLEEFFIDRVFELAPVRHEVFEKSNDPAIAPAAILFYRYAKGANTNNNIVNHITLKPSRFFSLFKIFTINRSDYKLVQQKKFKDFDWLWKVLVYGSYLDFNFLKRLTDEYDSIRDIISDKSKFIEGTGIQYSSNPLYDATHLIGHPFIDSYSVNSFFIDFSKISLFEKLKVHRRRDERLFKAPMLLIREGIELHNLTAKCAISTQDVLFKDSITSIKSLSNNNIDTIYNIAAILSSSLFAYYAINTFVSIGIERERVKNYNKYSLPYIDLNVKDKIKSIEKAYQEIYLEKKEVLQDNQKIDALNKNIQTELNNINETIYSRLKLNEIETALIKYSLDINRIFIVGNNEEKVRLFFPLKYEDVIINKYVSLFIQQFKSKLSNENRKFIAEIWYTEQIIGVFFRMIPIQDYQQDIVWINKQNNAELISFISKIGVEKITDKLFVQKDIRGFDSNGNDFFIIKPNEKRLWYEAIGYIDVNEFSDAIIKIGRGL